MLHEPNLLGMGWSSIFRKILVSIIIFAHNSGAENGCAKFTDAWKIAFFLQENHHAHKIPLFRGVGYFGFFWGGGGVPILLLWARGFFRKYIEGRARFSIAAFPHFHIPITFGTLGTLDPVRALAS